jgi:transposase
MRLARNDAQVRRLMTAPGVGPITALCFLATIDDPTRFKKSRSVGAYLGLTTRRYASGEIDWTGRISKCGDKMLRSYLYEAANVLLTRVKKMVNAQSLGRQACEAERAAQSQGRRCSEAGRHSAPDVDRRYRIQLVIKGGHQSTCIAEQSPR